MAKNINLAGQPVIMKYFFLKFSLLFLLLSCANEDESTPPPEAANSTYAVSGRVTDSMGKGMEAVKIYYSPSDLVLTDSLGYWVITDLSDQHTITPTLSNYSFSPSEIQVSDSIEDIIFIGTRIIIDIEKEIFNWFDNQQLANGLCESAENGNFVSLYDNALAAMVFMLKDDFTKAEKIFDFFDAQIAAELTNGVGGFSQFRDGNGVPTNHRWMGDNAWLLIALNNYKERTGKNTYDNLANELSHWLMSLQDTDGGLFAGYDANGNLINNKVTEGMIDAFNAIDGYTDFHSKLLDFLKIDRWDAADKNLMAWPTNPRYIFAMDVHPWSYLIFEDYPVSALTSADRFLNTQTAANGARITGYCFDEDKDAVWLEGTGQMAVAFAIAGMESEKEHYLEEMEKVLIQSSTHAEAVGFPYASNRGTQYGAGLLWEGVDTNIAISGGAWYLFAKYEFSPFAVGRVKMIPSAHMFWLY
jgi:hypothetical protein